MALLQKTKRRFAIALGTLLATLVALVVGQKDQDDSKVHIGGMSLPPSIAYADTTPGGDNGGGDGHGDSSGGSDNGSSGSNSTGCSARNGSSSIGGTDGGTDGGPGGPGDGP